MSGGPSRRRVLEGALAVIAAGLPCCGASARPPAIGCAILPDRRPSFAVNARNAPAPALAVDDLFATMTRNSGKGEAFERALGELLVIMARAYRVRPGFGFFDDARSPNAVAVNTAWVEGTEGTVGFGMRLLDQHLFLDPEGASVAAICAHEFAHIFQFKSGDFDALGRSGLPAHATELHADYLAGALLQRLVQERPDFPLVRVGQAWERMGASDFSNPGTHGRTEERLAAIQRGFFDAEGHGGSDMRRGAADGVRYLRSALL